MTTPSGQDIVNESEKFIGDPYVYGAAGPNSFDCSGLIQYSLEQLGYQNVPRTSEAQWAWVQKLQENQIQPGDLIFEQWPGDNASPGHVVLYAGSGQVVEAPETGKDVQVRSWSPSADMAAGAQIVGYGRVPGIAGGTTSGSNTTQASFSLTDPSSWVPSIIGSVFGNVEKPINDVLERAALIVFGALLVVLGIIRFTGSGTPAFTNKSSSDKSSNNTNDDTGKVTNSEKTRKNAGEES